MTTIHNLHKEKMGADDIYIGRAGKGQDGYFGNPFHLGTDSTTDSSIVKGWPGYLYDGTREEVLVKYREYFYKRIADDKTFKEKIDSLKDKRLFCFCAPLACHGDVIVEYLDK